MKHFFFTIFLSSTAISAVAASDADFLKSFSGWWSTKNDSAQTPGINGNVSFVIDRIQTVPAGFKFDITAQCSYQAEGIGKGWVISSNTNDEKLAIENNGSIHKNCFSKKFAMGSGDLKTGSIRTASCWDQNDGKPAGQVQIHLLTASEIQLTVRHGEGETCSGIVTKN